MVSEELVKTMKKGSVIVDLSVDQEDALKLLNVAPYQILFLKNMALSTIVSQYSGTSRPHLHGTEQYLHFHTA